MRCSTRWWLALALALALPISVGPAPAAAAPASQPPTQLRVVNAIVTAPVVGLAIDGVPVAPPLPYGANPPYVAVAPGPHTLTLTPPLPPTPILTESIAF